MMYKTDGFCSLCVIDVILSQDRTLSYANTEDFQWVGAILVKLEMQ